jgi:hypothetical protein
MLKFGAFNLHEPDENQHSQYHKETRIETKKPFDTISSNSLSTVEILLGIYRRHYSISCIFVTQLVKWMINDLFCYLQS